VLLLAVWRCRIRCGPSAGLQSQCCIGKSSGYQMLPNYKDHAKITVLQIAQLLITYFQENTCVLGESFHSFPLNLFVCNNARDHPMHHRALREISNSPHVIALIPHGTHRLVESAPSTGVKQCHGPPCSAVAFSRLNAKYSPSAVPSN
jgi:hypothetical protein